MVLLKVLFGAPLLFIGISSQAQNNFTVRNFDKANGLASNFTESLNQDPLGHLIIANKAGLDRFNGTDFEHISMSNDSTVLESATCIYRDKEEIWVGKFDGNIGKFNDGVSIVKTGINGQIKHIYKDAKDGIWAFSRSGMVFWANGIDTGRFDMAERDMLINAVIPYKYKEFIIGSNDGLWLIRFESGNDFQVLRRIEGLPETRVTALKYDTKNDLLWVGTEDAGLHRVKSPFSKDQKIEQFFLNSGETIDNVQTIFTDHLNRIWLGTFGNGLIRIEFYGEEGRKFVSLRFDENVNRESLIRDIFEDSENNIWIATFGGGLIQIIENVFYHPFDEHWLQKQSISQLFRDSKGNIWIGINNGIFKTSEYASGSQFQYFHVGGNKISAISEDKHGKIWVGTPSAGLFYLGTNKEKFVSVKLKGGRLANAINGITTSNDGVFVSTKSGFFRLSFNGLIEKHLSTVDGLPHNNIRSCFQDSVGRIWVANQGNRVSYLWKDEVRFIEGGSAQSIVDVNHILEDNQGRLWFATLGQGLFVLDNGNAHNIGTENGLPSNYCYQMVIDNSGYVWVSHQKSITRISPELTVSRTVSREELSSIEQSMISFLFKDDEGNIWISTTHDVVKFNPFVDESTKSVPQLSITSMKVFNDVLPLKENLILPYQKYSISFNLAGISLRNPENIRYKYQLEGFSNYWSDPISSNVIRFPRLEDGEYTLKVTASKNGGSWTPVPVEYSFEIERPFWKQWAFYVALFFVVVALIIAFVRYRTYRLITDNEDLENLVTERTIEVERQKTEIERSRDEIAKHAKDITDSIRYAKRIQKAIFPSVKDVQAILPESLVLFRSKDLVSGDFYFAEKQGTKRIFGAVDCTGHGVPGGFMSIVATNLLQQAINQIGLSKPSEILEYLNLGVTNTLHQTYEESVIKDGMDIAMCSWDQKTNILEFAGAYNPLYLFRDGELIEYKGNRFPVGTFVGEEIRQFTNHKIQLQKGDMLYLFSDGYADQFGGPDGKKFKIRRFKALLHEVHKHPVEEQYKLLKKRLDNWMGSIEQIDDIVILGVRIS